MKSVGKDTHPCVYRDENYKKVPLFAFIYWSDDLVPEGSYTSCGPPRHSCFAHLLIATPADCFSRLGRYDVIQYNDIKVYTYTVSFVE